MRKKLSFLVVAAMAIITVVIGNGVTNYSVADAKTVPAINKIVIQQKKTKVVSKPIANKPVVIF